MASAMGLRHVLPVQTNRMIRLALSARVAASITPSRSMLQLILVDLDHRRELLILRRPGVDHHVEPGQAAQRLGRRRDRVLGSRHHRDDERRRQKPQHVADDRLSRAAQRDVAVRRDQRLDLARASGCTDRRPCRRRRPAWPGRARAARPSAGRLARSAEPSRSPPPGLSRAGSAGAIGSDLRMARTRATASARSAQAARP